MKAVIACLLLTTAALNVSGCAVATKTAGQQEAVSFGKGCAVLVDSPTEYQVACTAAEPQKIIQAIRAAKGLNEI